MLLPFTDAETGNTMFVNPKQVAVIFEGTNPQGVRLTMINLLNGNIATEEDLLTVVGKIQGELRNG
jgi:hypothetical protein